MKVCWIECFENPDKKYLITRKGKARRHGGKGVSWSCSCPYGNRTQPCEHLMFVNINFVKLPIYENIVLLQDGKKYYKKFIQEEIDSLNMVMEYLD